MFTKTKKHLPFIILLIIAVLLALFRFRHGQIQQDNYVAYAGFLPFSVANISFFESRLLPGAPILIYLLHFLTGNYFIAGYMLTILSFAGSYILLYKMTGSRWSFLPLVFPPMMLNLVSLIDTEMPFIFLILLAIYLYKKNMLHWAFLALGISVIFRIAGVAVFAGMAFYMILNKKFGKVLINLPYFLIPLVLLVLYNVHFFGIRNPFYQLFTYEALHPSRISFGLLQLGEDLIRAARWHWYRILFSGIFYIAFYIWVYWKALKKRGLEFWIITAIYIFTLGINLVPFLENLGRYLAPAVPVFWLIFNKKLGKTPFVVFLYIFSVLIVAV